MFISLGYLSKKMLIPLLIPVLYNIRHYLLDFFDEKIDNTDNAACKVLLHSEDSHKELS